MFARGISHHFKDTVNIDASNKTCIIWLHVSLNKPQMDLNSKVAIFPTNCTSSLSVLVGQTGTLIPDDIIEEALIIMKAHSPELAPNIGLKFLKRILILKWQYFQQIVPAHCQY